ncbi:ATP-binding cassette sub-family C member Sur [Calliphora vicina]|uniref:ATP-binding cassette sub-family C member Sur n=1 Tax=Calliphora vicina TaxID=7373 RepID=UPI00325B88F8
MGLTIYCENVKAETIYEQLGTDICSITTVKWEASIIAATLLLAIIVYMLWKFKFRCHKALLTFHNLRAAVALLLFAINTIELAKALLPLPSNINDAGIGGNSANNGYENNYQQGNGSESNLPQQQQQTFIDTEPDHIVVVIGFASLANALAALILTIMLIWYHRLVETKKSLEFLYVSSTLSVLIFILRIYELAEIVYYDSIMALESIIQASSAFCLLLLAIIDGFTVYKERYRPDYLEDYDKIGYRHTLATFYSKACFWWLTPLLWFGYKEPLELEDLGQMRVEDSARAHYDRFLLIYKTAKVKNSNKPPSLWLCYLKSSWRMFTLGGLLKLFGDLFAVIGPLAIQQIVQYIENMYALQYNKNSNSNNNNNALLQMNTSKSNNISRGNNNTSITPPEMQTSLSSLTSLLAKAATSSYSTLLSNEENEDNLGRSIRSPINIQAAVVKTVKQVVTQAQEAAAAAATGSIWLPNLNDTYNNGNSHSNINSNYRYNENNTNVYNQIANGIDYIDTTSYSSSSPYSNLYSSGAEVKIYYPTWLDLLANGWAIAWLVLLAALAQGALSQASTHILNMTGIRIKTSLQGLIYRKTLLLNSTCIGGGDGGVGAADVTETLNINSQTTTTTNEASNVTTTPPVAGSKTENSVNANCQNEPSNNMANNNHKDTNYLKANKNGREEIENSLSDIGAITNLMSEDTLNIMSFFWIAHYVWAIPLKIAIVMYLLYLKLGISAVIGSFVCILTMTPLQFLIGKAMSKNTEVMAKFTDNRLRKLHDCFVAIKLIKLNAWDNVFIKKITEARKQELKYLNKDSFYWTIMTILTHISSVLITFVTLAVYVYRESGADFTASRLFSALALFQQLTVPLLIFPITVPIILSAVVSTKRLETFLAAHEIQKQFEGIRNMARILSKSDASLDMYEVKSQSLPSNIALKNVSEKPKIKIIIPDKPAPLANSEPHTPLVICDTKEPLRFSDDHKKLSLHARKELLRNTPYVVIRPRKLQMSGLPQAPAPSVAANVAATNNIHRKTDSWHRDSLLLKMPDDIAVSVKDCKFSWNPQKLLQILYIRDIVILRGKLTMIVGKNGSGKSSLLSALLMEMPLISGDMIWNKTSTIAFVPQQPWLLNASIRENILFGESFRPRRYDFVLEACALKPDIELMPAGDLTVIGERGINMSGGQRQRVAIARALYSSANVVIMDDPLSSLDNEVARHIFEQSIKKMLLKANRTVILVTQQLNLLQQAHNLIVLKDGCLQASGSYKDIEVTHPHIIAKWNSIIAKANAKDQQNNSVENAALGRTARERWKLFKNVAKVGLQRSTSITNAGAGNSATAAHNSHSEVDAETEMKTTISMENILAADDDEDAYNQMMPVHSSMISHNTSFKLKRTPSTVYGSRHLIYDVPLPLDECQTDNVILRRRRRTSSRSDSQQKARPSSRTSSRLSNISNTPTELRRSLLTNSCSSANSYMTNLSSNYGDESPSTRTQSWQPVGATNNKQHQPVARNISSPPAFDEQQVKEEDEKDSDAALVADLVKTSGSNNGFQQFLRRMSMRKSCKPKGVVTVQHNRRQHGNTGSILSISEESGIAGCSAASVPSIELSSVAATDAETETESWIAGIENEESIQDANIDYKMLLANNENNSMKTGGADVATACNKPICNTAAAATTTTLPQTLAEKTTTNYDVERKYGKIPAEIYLLYLRASGLTIVLIFFITALIWQTLRVYTDVWLQQWTDYNIHSYNLQKATAVAPLAATKNISALHKQQQQQPTEQQMSHKYASAATTTTMTAFASASVVSSGATMTENVDRHEVTYYFHIYAAISGVCIVMAMLSTPAGQWAGCKARQNLHDKLLQSIMHKSLHFFQITPLGRIMNRFSNDMAIIDKKIAATSQRLLQFTLLCLCAILINVIITPWFMVVTIPVCLAYYAIQKFYRCSSRELQRIENSTNSPVISHLSETIQGVTTIRAYNQESRFTEILFRRLEENTIAFTILNTSNRWLGISLDYLGGVIVFVAIVTALLAATIACNSYSKQQQQQQSSNDEHMMTGDTKETLLPLTPTPSLVGLAINYTLLMPIYLNWVVKLLADMEMYVGSVERIAYYADASETMEVDDENNKLGHPEETTEKTGHNEENRAGADDVANVSCSSNNNCKECIITKENNEDIVPNTLTITGLIAKSTTSPDNNDKCLNLTANNKTTDNNVDTATATACTINKAATDDDTHHHLTNDGHIAAETTKTLAHKQQTTIAAAAASGAGATKCDDNNDMKTIATSPRTSTAAAKNIKNKKSFTSSNSNTSSKPLERNDAERRASVRRLAKYKKQYKPVAISWPQRGDISFENVSLRYEGQPEDVIKNLNLTIASGQRIGICGRTGSGKSSLALSLFGVLQISHGCIRIDGNDIATIHPDEIRTRLSIIPQDVHLFSMTVRENLDPSGYYSDLELWNCLELAQLKEFVNTKMPQGLDTEILDGGLNLSVGHRQLFCLARAILRGSVCLVLDEATSALDATTERALLNAAHKAFQGRTIITIAHRLSTIMDYDRIIVLDQGKIIEDGSPQELKQKPDGIFSTLIHSGRPLSAISLDDVLN